MNTNMDIGDAHGGRGRGGCRRRGEAHWVGIITTSSAIAGNVDRRVLQSVLPAMDCTVLFDGKRDTHYMGFCKQTCGRHSTTSTFSILDLHHPAFLIDLDSATTRLAPDGTLHNVPGSLWDQRQVGLWYEAFRIVNGTFVAEVARMVRLDDVVWVHNYHLSLMPRLLGSKEWKRASYDKKGARGARLMKKIFFLQVPFPPSMIFKEMECGADILEGMLNADIVGFHGFTDARHFLLSIQHILGVAHESFEEGLIGIKYKKRIIVVTMSTIEPHWSTVRDTHFALFL